MCGEVLWYEGPVLGVDSFACECDWHHNQNYRVTELGFANLRREFLRISAQLLGLQRTSRRVEFLAVNHFLADSAGFAQGGLWHGVAGLRWFS